MSNAGANKGWWTPVKVGLVLTGLVLAGFGVMAVQRNCVILETSVLECRGNWAWFWASRPNEIGDTLAGFAGTLAFIWIVVTVWLQSNELREQREVMREQKVEFALMVSAQNAQVAALEAQAQVFLDEKVYRDHDRASKKLNALVARIATLCRRIHKFENQLALSEIVTQDIDYWIDRKCSFFAEPLSDDDEILVRELARQLLMLRLRLAVLRNNGGFEEGLEVRFKMAKDVIQMRDVVVQLLSVEEQLGADQIIRFENLELEGVIVSLDDLIALPIWTVVKS